MEKDKPPFRIDCKLKEEAKSDGYYRFKIGGEDIGHNNSRHMTMDSSKETLLQFLDDVTWEDIESLEIKAN